MYSKPWNKLFQGLEQSVPDIGTSDRRHSFVCAVKNHAFQFSVILRAGANGIDDDDSDDSGGIYFSNGGVVSLSIYHNYNIYII